MSTIHLTVDHTALGPLTLVATDDHLSGLYFATHARRPEDLGELVELDAAPPVLRAAHEQLTEYLAGERTAFDLPVRATGTPFQHEVWRMLGQIPYGQTWSYGQLAAALGKPGASRAVGLANGRNPVSIVVPCHRVIGADGSITGYGGGVAAKQTLLDLERATAGSALF